MAYFIQSLSGAALEWYTRQDASRWYTWDDMDQAFAHHFQYNIDIVPDRLYLTKVEKKPSESFREYGFRWREQAARVNPPMEEDEMVKYFHQALEPTYYGHLILAIGKSFNDVVKMGEIVEEWLKSSKIMSYSAIKATTQAIQSGTGSLLGKKKKEDVAVELVDTKQIVIQSPDAPNINQNPLPAHEETHMIEIVHKDGEPKKSSKSVMMIRASESNLVKAQDSTKATPLTVEGVTEKPSSLNSNPTVLVVKGMSKDIGASPESSKVVVPGIPREEIEEEVNEARGLTRSGRCFTPEELRKAKPFKDSQMPVKKSVTEEEDEELLKKMKVQDYSIVEQVLMKILNEEHVPDTITVNHLEKIAGKIFEENRITFSNDELPMEGTEHNRALYLTVKCEDSVVSRVLVDNGSSANICPLSTLQKLKIGTKRIHLNSMCVRGFDGGGKDSVGDIMLELSIGLVEFTMELQVLDVAVSYNLLLGRPWIHATKVSRLLSTKCVVEKINEGECIPGPKLSSASVMVANEMLKNGFVPGKGLGSSLQGIVHPVRPSGNLGAEKPPTSLIPKPVVDVDEELIKRFQRLFDEVNMVEVGEGSSKADVQLVGPNVKLSNWEATPLPTKKEFCSFNAGCSDMTCMKNFQLSLKSQSNSEITIQEDNVRVTKISVHLEPQVKEEIIKTLFEYKDVFAWSYDDMPGLNTDLVVHKFPTDPAFPPIKQTLRKFKTDMSVKIKEEITKQLTAKVIRVTRYPT
ncbi:uncharacterized protein [Nicotiana sylvestris]|uniref:uncharacterized protein n=1 Tax=Nicotiana sylvestris TaxID=4096 RepID=UPI00388C76F6